MSHLESAARAIPPSAKSTITDDEVPDTFAGELITLSPLRESDAFDVFAYAGHKQVTRTATWDPHRDPTESRQYIRQVCARCSLEKGRTFVAWAVRGNRERRVLGHMTFTERGEIRGQIGYVFHYELWRRRLPIEALRLAISVIFGTQPRFERIQALCLPTNVASCDLLAAVGMPFEGVQRSMMRVRGELVDLAGYAMTRRDWLLRRESWRSGAADVPGDGHV